MDNSPNLSLPYIAPSQAQKHVTVNEALRALDALVQLAVLDRDLAQPPASPAEGDRYIVAAGATGAWTGHDGEIAAFEDGAWMFHRPREGWLAFVADEGGVVAWHGGGWTGALQWVGGVTAPTLGVNATADAGNRLAVKSPASLFDNEGAGHQMKLNKAHAADTASLLLQTGYSGRAEIGLAGDDDLHLKVSADGTSWTEALRTETATGDTILGGLRVDRDMVENVLPDSGRFNGNANNSVFSGIAYSAPTYLTAISGGSIASYAKFIHGNTDYGGSAGALDPEVKALVDKIRPSNARKYGPEWYVVKVTQTGGAMSEAETISGTDYGLPFTNTFVPMPGKFTAAYYVRVLSGSAALIMNPARSGINPYTPRGYVDGVLQADSAVVLTNADGWKAVTLHNAPYLTGYDYFAFRLKLPASAVILFAMPKIVFGHVELDPDLGVLMNARMFG